MADRFSQSFVGQVPTTSLHISVNMADFTLVYSSDEELKRLHNSTSMTFADVSIPSSEHALMCNISKTPRPFFLEPFKKTVFESVHCTTHL